MVAVGLYIASLAARNLDLQITAWVLEASAIIGGSVLILAFHGELRYAILRFNGLFRLWPREARTANAGNRALTDAVFSMAETRTGALIVILGRVRVADLTTGGIRVGADVSRELLEVIFRKDSPLHDGAVIIENSRISHANVVLPLSEKDDLPNHYGTRHRAGIGLSEHTDALVITVSEQRGEVSLIRAGRIVPIQSAEQLLRRLSAIEPRPIHTAGWFLAKLFTADLKVKTVAVALAACVCLISPFTARTVVRVVSVPVQFTDVTKGTELLDQSSPRVILQLRGNNASMDSGRISRLVAHFSVKGVDTGMHSFRVNTENVDLPSGISLETATPESVSIRVVRPVGDVKQLPAQGS